eukprot:6595981-Prymnesium_polylepis.1
MARQQRIDDQSVGGSLHRPRHEDDKDEDRVRGIPTSFALQAKSARSSREYVELSASLRAREQAAAASWELDNLEEIVRGAVAGCQAR